MTHLVSLGADRDCVIAGVGASVDSPEVSTPALDATAPSVSVTGATPVVDLDAGADTSLTSMTANASVTPAGSELPSMTADVSPPSLATPADVSLTPPSASGATPDPSASAALPLGAIEAELTADDLNLAPAPPDTGASSMYAEPPTVRADPAVPSADASGDGVSTSVGSYAAAAATTAAGAAVGLSGADEAPSSDKTSTKSKIRKLFTRKKGNKGSLEQEAFSGALTGTFRHCRAPRLRPARVAHPPSCKAVHANTRAQAALLLLHRYRSHTLPPWDCRQNHTCLPRACLPSSSLTREALWCRPA